LWSDVGGHDVLVARALDFVLTLFPIEFGSWLQTTLAEGSPVVAPTTGWDDAKNQMLGITA